MLLDEIETAVVAWGYDKGILQAGNQCKQTLKMASEAGEVCDAVAKQDYDEIIDGIGDVAVTLILLAHMNEKSLTDCLIHAYSVIANRKGVMQDGVFIKEEG